MYEKHDRDRDYHLYRYLLGRLAISYKSDGSANANKTNARVGGNDALRRLLPDILLGKQAWENALSTKSKPTKTTAGYLVSLLVTLRQKLRDEYKKDGLHYNRLLTSEDILTALYQLIELTSEEREQLNLPAGDSLTLLNQILLTLQSQGGVYNEAALLRTYKETVGVDAVADTLSIGSLDQVDELIDKTVETALSHIPDRPASLSSRETIVSRENTVRDLAQKAKREVRRLLARSGNTQAFFVDSAAEHPYIRQYLQSGFVTKLARTVVENERLTAQFPVYLRQITVQACGPLPFADTSLGSFKFGSSDYPPLLHKKLQNLDGSVNYTLSSAVPGPSDYELAAQEAMKVTIGFYIKVPSKYQSSVPQTFNSLASRRIESNPALHRRVDFTFSGTGIGGTLSHAIKLINVTLLSDIPCLDSFFSIAHDITSTQSIIKDNVPSPIWAHSLIKLCHKESVGKALWSYADLSASYDKFSFGEVTGKGDFCGFDFLLAQAKASLQARLQAIRNTGVRAEDYIQQLCNKVEQRITLRRAWQELKYYPFSSLAMISTIRRTILKDVWGNGALRRDTHYVCFDACLSITEVLLDEGAYRVSYDYIQRLSILRTCAYESLVTQGGTAVDIDRCGIFSSTLIIRYLICVALYYYLYDEQEENGEYLLNETEAGASRQQLVQKAWETLDLAQQNIEARLKKYVVVGEISQGTFHPHYELSGRIYAVRAKLLMFFSRFVPETKSILPTENFSGNRRTKASAHWGSLYLMEKARLYVAADGKGELYAYYASMQSCLYSMAAYSAPEDVIIQTGSESRVPHELTCEECLTWSRRLRDHALLAYAETGYQCYNAIKEKSGLPGITDEYGQYLIEKLPAIFEERDTENMRKVSEADDFLTLNISLLAVSINDLPKLTVRHPKNNIYLFGTNACYLFFARGIYLLCSETTQEFAPSGLEPPEFETYGIGNSQGRNLQDQDNHQTETEVIDWSTKLKQAQRLFDMAWAIAEDGCSLEPLPDSDHRKITRSFGAPAETEYSTQEIASVRDLYPRRVNEIADLGKVFSAACMVLQLYTVSPQARSPIIQNIKKILNMFHGAHRLNTNPLFKDLLLQQSRYNGGIESHLSSARAILNRFMKNVPAASAREDLRGERDDLLQALFAALMGELEEPK